MITLMLKVIYIAFYSTKDRRQHAPSVYIFYFNEGEPGPYCTQILCTVPAPSESRDIPGLSQR
jgi:hypothetical protein